MRTTEDTETAALAASDLTGDFDCLRPLVEGLVVVLTGATRGLGRALALYYAKLGAHVVADGRDETLLREVAGEARKLAGTLQPVPGDVADAAHRRTLVDAALREYGRVDVLVNNAAVIADVPLAEATPEQWRYVLEVNLDAVFFLTQLVGTESMLPRGAGKVVNFSSILGTTALPGQNSYAAAKGGVEQLTRGFASEWARHGVNVNAIAPGYHKTRMNHEARQDAGVRELMLAKIPARRLGETEDVVGPTLFLSTSLSDYCHGTILAVDGGVLCL
jgi:NAD(P)-dependent dehydrogenase (short-subunit alcohol dehydrogenase family)